MPTAHVFTAERRVVKRLQKAGALSPRTACALPDLRPMQRARLRHLLSHDIVREAGANTYYLNLAAWEDHRSRQRRLGLFFAIGLLMLGFILWASTR